MKKKETKSPLWLMIQAVTIPELMQRLFEKSSKIYKIDWEAAKAMNIDKRADFIFEHVLKLHAEQPHAYLDFYSSLRYIVIASETKNILKLMLNLREHRKTVKSKFLKDEFTISRSASSRLTAPANLAAWYCVMEKNGLEEEWSKIVDLVNNEEAGRMPSKIFSITPPRKVEEEEVKAGMEVFKREFGKAMEDLKKMDFPIEVHPFPSTGKYVRYVVNVPKDPTKAFLVQERSVSIGLDPTMHKFYVDHYFGENKLRVSWPVMCEEREAAEHFARHVLGSEIVDEVVRYYTRALRNFTSSARSKHLMELSDKDKEDIASIRISSVDFTYAESESEAEKIRRKKENKKKMKNNEPLRPAFKCYNYKGDDIWHYLDEHFSPARYKAEWRDILSITFSVELYVINVKSDVRVCDRTRTKKFSIICKPNKLDYRPKMHEIIEPEYKTTLRYIAEKKLNLEGLLLGEHTRIEKEEGADGSLL